VVAASRRTRSGDEGASDSYKQARDNQESAMQAEARDEEVLSEVGALRETVATLKRMIAEKDHAIGTF
jgi:Mg2+ and Co2+ transporter CorA